MEIFNLLELPTLCAQLKIDLNYKKGKKTLKFKNKKLLHLQFLDVRS